MEDPNGRVTLAVLKATIEMESATTRREIDRLIAKLDGLCDRQTVDHERLVKVESRTTDHDREIEGLRKRDFLAGGLAALIAAATAILSAVLGKAP